MRPRSVSQKPVSSFSPLPRARSRPMWANHTRARPCRVCSCAHKGERAERGGSGVGVRQVVEHAPIRPRVPDHQQVGQEQQEREQPERLVQRGDVRGERGGEQHSALGAGTASLAPLLVLWTLAAHRPLGESVTGVVLLAAAVTLLLLSASWQPSWPVRRRGRSPAGVQRSRDYRLSGPGRVPPVARSGTTLVQGAPR